MVDRIHHRGSSSGNMNEDKKLATQDRAQKLGNNNGTQRMATSTRASRGVDGSVDKRNHPNQSM